MTNPLFQARLQVTNGGGTFDSQGTTELRGDGLDVPRIEFTVNKTLDPTPNTAEIRISNLSQATLDKITGTVTKRIEFTPEEQAQLAAAGASSQPFEVTYDNFGLGSIVLSWGYAGSNPGSPFPPLSVGFIGASSRMAVERGLTTVLKIDAEDGGQLVGAARLVKSYKAGTNTVDILVDLINACGLTVDKAKLEAAMLQSLQRDGFSPSKIVQIRGYNAAHPAAELIRSIMTARKLRWSVQDGEFLVVGPDTVLAGYPALSLSTTDGTMLGKPEQLEAQQLRARTNANAEARPGREVDVQATGINAQYRIDSVKHTGDTDKGGESEVTLDAIQVIPGLF